jgi:hypothetical protein
MARIAQGGLFLPKVALQRLQESGIYCAPQLSVAFQQSTQQHVIRARESGGAIAGLGAYCGVVSSDGSPLRWLQLIETIGLNGLHACAVASSLVRVQVVRVHHTYDLLITKHSIQTAQTGTRPQLENTILFYGRQGTLQMELWGKDSEYKGRVAPVFYDRAGDLLTIPTVFEQAVKNAIAGACCSGCEHTHVLVPPECNNEAALTPVAVPAA